jgi:preprotein translocase subunit SecE
MGRTTDNLGEGNMATPRPQPGDEAPGAESRVQFQVPRPPTWLGGVRHFAHEVALEMRKVSWPTRTEVINTTMVVIIAVFFFAFFLFGTDIVLSYLIKFIELGAKKLFG